MVRYQHDGRVHADHGGRGWCGTHHRARGQSHPCRLHRLETALDEDIPAGGLRAAGDHPAAARLPQLRADRRALQRVRGRVRYGLARRAHAHLVDGPAACNRSRPRSRRLPAADRRAGCAVRHRFRCGVAVGTSSHGQGSRRWRRQHDGGHRHRLRGRGTAGDEPGNLGHAVRLFRYACGRSGRRLGGVLFVDRRLAAADLHDELHGRDKRHRPARTAW